MGNLAALWRTASTWYVSLLFLAALGVVIGYFVFFKVFPGKPQIGVIDIPFTVINDDSAFVIGAYLDYAGRTDSIKGVVIRLTSPGGGAAASEQLFMDTRALREKKPVVITMNDLVASGGYMMSMGANYIYTKGSTLVGNVGVILSYPGPLIPYPPSEDIISTGPHKLDGGSRRDWIAMADQLKQGFAQIVVTERGDKLRLSRDELLQGRIYSGIEGVKLGLVDDIGGDTQALRKAASLAGISSYGLVDVNAEVQRLFNEKFRKTFSSLEGTGVALNATDTLTLKALPRPKGSGDSSQIPAGSADLVDLSMMPMLRTPFRFQGQHQTLAEALPDFPLKINGPNVYYLYVGPSK